ncbi:N-acetyl-gamma-glutamyl-phosphate reductase [Fictibacillus terranigra]|uniref:N-acetyl-gamma-glutamyl-phosphate reductase n=1 Tax=Fictibacillus terranigra TaxID=3058424 RepID=A0ABT8E750_9BACL|nr:N-acetyl-gamma-glutamyl-phosphate reductase [Fictibacillus sp. CENA-BCM004]MDN4073720.1 N-acetyl-gamma-glutamyl-phosphate reductase [Fictibacillus sp. CENA-BCM004]
MNVGIVGATGFGGLELVRLLKNHPRIKKLTLYSSSKKGDSIDRIYPHLNGIEEGKLEDIDPYNIPKQVDFLFSSAPTGVSASLLPPILEQGMKVIDLAGDYRLKESETYKQWYQKEPPDAKWVDRAVYGLSEWNTDQIAHAQMIANPGCYPTAALLGLLPLVNKRLLDVSTIIIDAKSGVSGAGAVPSVSSHFPFANDNLQIYKVNKHQHIPEIEQMLHQYSETNKPITFSTHLVPMTRGIMSTMYAKVKDGVSAMEIEETYTEYAEQHEFIRLSPAHGLPSTKHVMGSNYCDIGWSFDPRTQRITAVSVIDNLMKGAAGQAVHNFNLMNGFPETAGLPASPVFP